LIISFSNFKIKCKIVKIHLHLAVKTFLLLSVLIFSNNNITLISESKMSHFYTLIIPRVIFFYYLNSHFSQTKTQNRLTEILKF